ncbi:ThuA domain-containing protein [Confluentibacter flavum]|uniref:Trehalose utilization n=1 Tax=Confluentibacter flavum TaxID=1909700 RepID=A0A2N3HI77_9FLAO|nr:ThuA domain-containing protein [Confluentibacter flavum]PKQ44603.1 trehalose utilization [Confluentibacter flavum]
MRLKIIACIIICSIAGFGSVFSQTSPKVLKALIIDGDSNHGIWPKSTFMIKDYLEQSGLFEVDIYRKEFVWVGPAHDKVEGITNINELVTKYPLNDGKEHTVVSKAQFDPNFNPDFTKYNVIVSNFGWQASELPEITRTNLEKYMLNGGGLVIVHAANNPWGDWEEFNKMIGLGGWGGRNEKTGPYVYYNENNEKIVDTIKGNAGSHGAQHNFLIETRAPEHPIMKGLPNLWLHNKDELYERLRGPAENMTVLATAYSDKSTDARRTGRDEPALMTIEYGKGRIFHTILGHMDYSMECAGFITTLQRGAEWVATGKVTQKIPDDFPTENQVSIRKWDK